MKQYRIVQNFRRYSPPTELNLNNDFFVSQEETIVEEKPTLKYLISLLQYTFLSYNEQICYQVEVYVKEDNKEKLGIELSFEDSYVFILIHPLNEIDETKPLIPDCKFVLVPYEKYQEIRKEFKVEQKV